MARSLRTCAAIAAAVMLTQPVGTAGAEPLLLPNGLYDITSRLELPHVERWAIDQTTRVCLSGHKRIGEIPLPVLSANNPFAKCAATNLANDGETFQYDIVCPGRASAKAHAIYTFAADAFSGRIAMTMAAKNMTMTEVQRAIRLGDCEPPLRSSAVRF
jgi:hypothetical protein